MRKHPRLSINCSNHEDMTKKSFRDECDINKIMEKFQRKGIIDHYAKHAPEYMDIPELQYSDALQIVIDADQAFSELPSTIRSKFRNDPSEFLSFVQDPSNSDEMAALGLSNPKPLLNKISANTTPAPAPAAPEPTANANPEGG